MFISSLNVIPNSIRNLIYVQPLVFPMCSACKHLLACITCRTATQYERLYGEKTSLSRHILRCSSTCFFIIFHPRHVAVLLTRQAQTGKTLLRHITLKQHRSTTDLAHSSSVFLQLPGAALRPHYSYVQEENSYTLSTLNDLFKRGLIPVFESQAIWLM